MANEVTSTNPNSISRISVGTTIVQGEIVTENDIRFDGNFDGKIYSKGRVIIGETSDIKGDVFCENFDVWGHFDGVINVKDTVSLKSGCSVKGSVNSGKLVVELGSKLDAQFASLSETEYDKLVSEIPSLKAVKLPVNKSVDNKPEMPR